MCILYIPYISVRYLVWIGRTLLFNLYCSNEEEKQKKSTKEDSKSKSGKEKKERR